MKMFTITVLVYICISFATTSFAWQSHYGNSFYHDSIISPYHQLHNNQYDYVDNNNNRRYHNGYNNGYNINYGYDDNNYKYNNEYYSYDYNSRYNQYDEDNYGPPSFNKNKNNYNDNSGPRNRNYEEDYITYDKRNQNKNSDNNHQQKQQFDETKTISDKPKELNNDEQKTVVKKIVDVKKPQSDYGSFVKGTYDDNYYKTDKRPKRKSNNGYNSDNGESSDCGSSCLDNRDEAKTSDDNKEYLLDYVLQRLIFRAIRNMNKGKYIKKSQSTNDLVQEVFQNCIKSSDLYNILIANKTDEHGIVETFNNYKRWNDVVEDSENKTLPLIDVIIKDILRETFHWLCDHELITSKLDLEAIVNQSFTLLQPTELYQSISKPEDDETILNIVKQNNWWQLKGKSWTDGNVKRWSWTSF